MIPLTFLEVRVSSAADTPVLVLREADGVRCLAVWISAAGGSAILSALEDGREENPTTHDLFMEILSVMDAALQSVCITGLSEGRYAAHLVVNENTVQCRVSDGVALALRCGAPIYASKELIEQASIVLAGAPGVKTDPDTQVEEFRAFLDQISADDFDAEP